MAKIDRDESVRILTLSLSQENYLQARLWAAARFGVSMSAALAFLMEHLVHIVRILESSGHDSSRNDSTETQKREKSDNEHISKSHCETVTACKPK